MKGWPYGSSLTNDGKIKYFSPSALMRADPGTSEGCMRAYYYQYVKKIKAEEDKWQTLGKEIHAQNEHYLLTGEKKMGPIAMAGLHMMPKPKSLDNRILIEHEIGGGDLSTSPLRASGIPVVGYIDCIHWQGTNPGSEDVMDTLDPDGTVEVIDWKTTSDPKWIKTAQEVSKTLQMTTYGKWAVDVMKAEHVRLSHGYFVTKGRHTPRKVTLRVHKDQINERWEYVEKLAGSLKEVVAEVNPDKVPANTRACEAFRGCPHQRYCSAYNHNSLSQLLGSDFAASLLGLDKETIQTIQTESGDSVLSRIDKLQKTKGGGPESHPETAGIHSELEETKQGQSGSHSSQTQTGRSGNIPFVQGETTSQEVRSYGGGLDSDTTRSRGPMQNLLGRIHERIGSAHRPQSSNDEVSSPAMCELQFPSRSREGESENSSERNRLSSPIQPSIILTIPTTEELTNQPMSTSLLARLQKPAEIKDKQSEMKRLALEEINTKYPGLGQTFADLEAVGLGMPALTGEAARAYCILKDTDVVQSIPGTGGLAECSFEDPSLLPQVLTEAKALVASGSIEVVPEAPAPEIANAFPEEAPPSLASPPEEKEEATVASVEDAFAVAAGETPAPKKRGRPKKITTVEVTAPAEELVDAPSPQAIALQTLADAGVANPEAAQRDAVPADTAINLYVDCIPSCHFTSFWPYVNEVTNKMAQIYKGDDYRTAEGMDFGKWKGILAAALRGAYEHGQIPPGNYLLDNTLNDTASVVIETMRDVVARSGGLLVRGIR